MEMDIPFTVGAIVIGSIIMLALIRGGFRGVAIGG